MLSFLVLGVITWTFTRNLEVTTIVTILFESINFMLYYIHERLWDRIDWGLLKKSDMSPEEQKVITERLKKLGYVE